MGCLIFELLTGDALFELSENDEMEGGDNNNGNNSREDNNNDESDDDSSDDVSSGSSSSSNSQSGLQGDEFATAYKHLQLIQNLLGNAPLNVIAGGEYSSQLFDTTSQQLLPVSFLQSQGINDGINKTPVYIGGGNKSRSLSKILKEDYGINKTEASKAEAIIMKCLKYNPSERITAGQLLSELI
jgi:serine/threonine protein kinase